MDLKRHAASAAVLAGFLGLNTATSKPRADVDASTPTVATAVVSGSTDLDVEAAIKALGCKGVHSDACRILEEFKTATQPTDFPTSGQDLWVGESFPLNGAGANREPDFLQLVPTATPDSNVQSTDLLDVSGSMRSLIPENAGEKKDSDAVLEALRHGKPPPKGSKAIEFMRTAAPPSGFKTMMRVGDSVGMLVDRTYPYSYFRKLGDRLLVIDYDKGATLTHKTGGPAADAWCTELWKVP